MKNLAIIRKEHKMSQSELAERIGVSQQTISKYEKGTREPDNQTLVKLSEIFDVSTDYLLGKTNIKNISREIPDNFETPEDAMKFILEQNVIMGFGGFDVYKMSDEEVIEFANELLNQLKILSYKYKK